ncbi:MAG: RluA family pseudouridine synthase, partial [Deltaproteobacteria bacterium]|nr:RluA family pseudouridine synthase [Deltaproteobacteria bacterium]
MPAGDPFKIIVKESESGRRLDLLVASIIPDCPRNSAASLVNNGKIKVSGYQRKAGYKVKTGEVISGIIPESGPIRVQPEPESISINTLFEDDEIIVVNKPPGMVVHPSPGHSSGTLVNALLYHRPDIKYVGDESRSGIVHRLDKDTSGVILIAKTPEAHKKISSDFKARRNVQKKYLALVFGGMNKESGKIDLPIGRHPADRKKISITSRRPRNAETFWKVKERYNELTLLELEIKTGRTHQIRVHCAAIHHPVVGDLVYGSRKTVNRIAESETKRLIQGVSRQMLHAWQLGIIHPGTGKQMVFEAPVPDDMTDVI